MFFRQTTFLILVMILSGCAHLGGGRIDSDITWEVWLENVKRPEGLAFDTQSRLYITSEAGAGSVWRSAGAGQLEMLALRLNKPDGLIFDARGKLYVSVEVPAGSVISLDPETGSRQVIVADVPEAEGLALDSKGRLYIAEDREGGRILRWKDGRLETFAEGLVRPENLAIDRNDYVYVAETGSARILQIATDGYRRILNRQMIKPDGMTYCAAYNAVFASEDVPHARIFFIKPNGAAGPIASQLKFPQGMICDAEGNLFVAESGRNRILRFSAGDLKRVLPEPPGQ